MTNNDSNGFKAFARHATQAELPNSLLFKSDCQTAIEGAITALNVLSDKLYILENFLEAAREEE